MIEIKAPYVGASDTSKARAQHEDAAGLTNERARHIYDLVAETGTYGATWKDISDKTGLHHGQVSSVLTRLHEHGHLFQLKTTRGNCHPYLVAALKDDFYDDERNDQPVKTKANAENAALKAVAKAAYNLCYSQSANAGEKWDALRKALKEIEIEND
jgi:hypothetical protein